MRLVISLAALWLPLLAVPTFADCAGDLQADMASTAKAGPQSIVSTVQTKASVITTVSEKVPGAMHSRRAAGGEVSEFTLVGDRAWSKAGDEWTELPADTAAGIAAAMQADTDTTFKDMGDLECLGVDPRTFRQSYRLTYREGDATVKAALEFGWNGLLSKLTTWKSLGGQKSFTVSQFTYDDSITVGAPN
jgi:hypothetical protein